MKTFNIALWDDYMPRQAPPFSGPSYNLHINNRLNSTISLNVMTITVNLYLSFFSAFRDLFSGELQTSFII